jgi:hypothetical protein
MPNLSRLGVCPGATKQAGTRANLSMRRHDPARGKKHPSARRGYDAC